MLLDSNNTGVDLITGSKPVKGRLELIFSTTGQLPVLVTTYSVRRDILFPTILPSHRATCHDGSHNHKETDKFGISISPAMYRDKLVPIQELIEIRVGSLFSLRFITFLSGPVKAHFFYTGSVWSTFLELDSRACGRGMLTRPPEIKKVHVISTERDWRKAIIPPWRGHFENSLSLNADWKSQVTINYWIWYTDQDVAKLYLIGWLRPNTVRNIHISED